MAKLLTAGILLLLLAGANCGQVDSEQQQVSSGFTFSESGELRQTEDGLAYISSDGERAELAAADDAMPYKVVTDGNPPFAVTVDELTPTTWVAAESPAPYENMIPALIDPPLRALISLPALGEQPRTVLIGEDGSAVYEGDSVLLLPYEVHGTALNSHAFIAPASADPLYGFGNETALECRIPDTGELVWRAELAPRLAVADLVVYAVNSESVLLFMQYGYREGDFVLLDADDGAELARHGLEGQVLYRAVYPGQLEEPSVVQAGADSLSLLAVRASQGFTMLEFHNDGTIKAEPASRERAGAADVNPVPAGQQTAGAPRGIFVTNFFPNSSSLGVWKVSALLRSDGKVLVVQREGADWQDLNSI